MQKNWYVAYTRPQCEKKVAMVLAKKKIECFIPYTSTETRILRKSKTVIKPLFKSYVFVYTTEETAVSLTGTEGVISILHWLGRPAVIENSEVTAIKEFTADYPAIDLERLPVNGKNMERNIYKSSYEIEGNLVAVKNKTIKINLPSLGYAMIANLKEESVFGVDRSLSQTYTFAQS